MSHSCRTELPGVIGNRWNQRGTDYNMCNMKKGSAESQALDLLATPAESQELKRGLAALS
jgi:hypothetical protein